MTALQALLGLCVFVGVAWLVSEDRRRFPWRLVLAGLAVQAAIGALFLWLPGIGFVFLRLNDLVLAIDRATKAGAGFMFGYLAGGPLPFAETTPGAAFIVFFQVLPIILVMSALVSVLYHFGVIQVVVRGFAYVLRRAMGIGGATGLAVAASVFLGIIEAPLFVKQYLGRMRRSDLFVASIDFARSGAALDAKSRLILTYALCGFANFGSLGILIGGFGTLVPERRPEVLSLGFKAILAGTLATMTTGAVIGLLAG